MKQTQFQAIDTSFSGTERFAGTQNIPPPPPSFPLSSPKATKIYRKLLYVLLFLLTFSILTAAKAQTPPGNLVYRLAIRDTIQPITAGRLDRALQIASRDHAAALLIELDTPGGLLESTRQMVGAILNSPVPVIVYIAPAGARAGSAGFFLMEAADIAAMAPGTNAGAAHPVLSSGTPDETMKMKLENDAAAFLRSYIGKHNRNPQAAEEAIRNSKSYSADEALSLHLIDFTAANETQLLSAMDNSGSTHPNLHLRNAQIVTIEPTIREEILSTLTNPNLSLLLLVGGALLIYLEFNVPGTIVPGAIGTVLALLGLFSLNLLPIRHTAVALILAGLVLLLLEIKFTSHGVLALAGILCLTFGSLTLIDSPIPELAIRPAVAIALSVAFGGITALLFSLAMRARRNKFLYGPAALVGHPATAMEPIQPLNSEHIGRILVQGEIWQAISPQPLPKDTALEVTGFQGDILLVHPVVQPVSSAKASPAA